MRVADSAMRLLELFLPPACAGCGGAVSKRSGILPRICPECRTRLKEPPHPRCARCDAPRGTGLPAERVCPECQDWPEVLRVSRSAVALAPPADRLVHALKYGGWPELGEALAVRMVRLYRRDRALGANHPHGSEVPIVPVPTTPGRLRVRGYNQARILAIEIAKEVGAPLVEALVREEDGGSQIGLLPEERRANVDEAFSLRSAEVRHVRARDVILVDDVLTTGATASAVASALERGGVRSVRLLTFARSLPEPD